MLPVVLLAALAGCTGGPGVPVGAAPVGPTAQFPPVPQPDPVGVCTNQLAYWAGEQLRGAPDVGYDYQHMALTDQQALALRDLVDEARGAALPPDAVRTRARELCAGLVASSAVTPSPSGR